MIRAKSIPKKTYKEWMEEKYTKIPIYTEEWTNFNPSDPGITILENLTAFLTLQQDRIDAVPDSVKEKLLELLGISLRRERCASVFIEARGVKKPFQLPANQQFRAGDISFETTFATTVPASRFTGVFGEDMDGIHDYSNILDRDVRLPAYVFGRKPQAKEKLYLVMDAPIPPGKKGLYGWKWMSSFSGIHMNMVFPSVLQNCNGNAIRKKALCQWRLRTARTDFYQTVK